MPLAKVQESLALSRWLDRRLSVLPGISDAYLDRIPTSAVLPAIRYSYLTAVDRRALANGLEIFMTRFQVLVVVVIKSNSVAPLVAPATALHQSLDGVYGETEDLVVLSSVRSQPFSQTTVEEGAIYRQAGGIYLIDVQAKDEA